MGEDLEVAYHSDLGAMWHGDSLRWLDEFKDGAINLVLTSPPFALTRQKEYGNQAEHDYIEWFMAFARKVYDKLAPDGSFVIDLGGAWLPGSATRSLYQYKLLIELVENLHPDQAGQEERENFYFAEDLYWYNRAKLPGPRQWVTIDRTRVKDAVNTLWWLSKSPNPKADNRKVLKPYSKSMLKLLERGTYNSGMRPSEHNIGDNWNKNLGGAIPPNVIEATSEELGYAPDEYYESDTLLDFSNTAGTDAYHLFCKANDIVQHPARFPRGVPEFFIKFLTNPGDVVVDIFGGSNMTGAVAQELGRRWHACDLEPDYIRGSLGRFNPDGITITSHGHEIGVRGDMFSRAEEYAKEQAEKRKAARAAATGETLL